MVAVERQGHHARARAGGVDVQLGVDPGPARGEDQGDEQQPIGGETTMDDESIQILLTNFIERAAFDVQVVEGGPVTVKGVRGRMEDPEDPFGDISVEEELYSSELASGGVEFELP